MEEQPKLQVLVGWPFVVAVDRGAPTELKLRVIAAAKSYQMQNKSIDYTLKVYGEDWRQQLVNESS